MPLSCPYHNDTSQSTNGINISQLGYIRVEPECFFEEGTCQLCEELFAVEKDIEGATTPLNAALMINRYQWLKTEINLTHSPIIYDLPVEILLKIFHSCFSDEMQEFGEPGYEDSFVPLKVGAVCRTWRQIVWSSPEFWTVISMKRILSSSSHSYNQYTIMEEWIERSGTLPLQVYFEEDVNWYDTDNVKVPSECQCWKRCLELLEKCCDRWEIAFLSLSKMSFEYIGRNLKLKPPFGRLVLHSPEDVWYREWLEDDSDVIPLNLREASSKSGPVEVIMRFPFQLGYINIDWNGIRYVEVKEWGFEEGVNLLKCAPRLESCSFLSMGNCPPLDLVHGGPVIPVHHNSLRYLYIECEGSPLTFFDLVTLPSLEELDYTYVRGRTFPEEAMQSAFLRDFIIRSHCPLKRLSLIAPPFIATDHLDTILRLLPSLVHFSLEFSDGFLMYQQKDVRDHLLSRLIATATIEDDAENFLPHLEVLELDYSGRIYDSSDISYWSSIIDIFGDPSKLGKEGRRPFSSLLITTDRPCFVMGLPGDVVDRLVSLQKAGAKINFRVRYDDGDCEVTPVKWA